MVPEPGDWTVPAPLRTLLWWPLAAFVLAILRPSSAAAVITATGVGLAVLGALAAAVSSARSHHHNSRGTATARERPIPSNPATDTITPITPDHRAA